MKMSFFARILVAGSILFGALTPALATPVTYSLYDTAFDAGSIATGVFTFDVDTGALNNYLINITEGNLPAYTYSDNFQGSIAFAENPGQPGNALTFIAADFSRYLTLTFAAPLSNAGGTFAYVLDDTFQFNNDLDNAGVDETAISGGATSLVVAVPEPATALLMLPMLAGMALVRRRRPATL
ncbi:MAG: PEP-CTERM sorting domain-containing protein [Janthinobacterium lividum]